MADHQRHNIERNIRGNPKPVIIAAGHIHDEIAGPSILGVCRVIRSNRSRCIG
ncbi:MAG: hypothetical protein IIC66_05425 [candidate division Zixibacteria bacterium]|nr:hypothetical protein [candidate division Zixibacteria bacterium]